MGECHHPINIGEIGQRLGMVLPGKMVGNGSRCGGRAIDRGQYTDVVARGHPAVAALVAHEAGFAAGWLGLEVYANRVVTGKVAFALADPQVLGVHMLASRYGLAGKADDLVIATHRLAQGNGTRGDFVPGRYQAPGGDAFNRGAAHQLASGNHHIIRGVQAYKWVHVNTSAQQSAVLVFSKG